MMDLVGLVSKAKNLFRNSEKATDVCVQDHWDYQLFDDIINEVPRVADLFEDIQMHHSYAKDLLRDVAQVFFQDAPQVHTADQMDPSRLLNHAVVTGVQSAPETIELRPMTRHDKYGAAMGVLSVAQKIHDLLDQPPQDDAQEKGENAASKQASAGEAMEALGEALGEGEASNQECEEAAQGLSEALAGYQGEGPLTQPQMSAAEALAAAQAAADEAAKALQAAIDAAEQAQAEADQATTAAERAADAARDHLDIPLREGIRDAQQTLNEEAALMRAWGSNPGQMRTKNYAEREALTQMMRRNRLSLYTDTLGRFKMSAEASKMTKVEYGQDEFYTTELSGDLDRILDEELASLGHRNRMIRRQAMMDFLDDAMVSRKYRGNEKIGKGALICCLDTSQSMTNKDRLGIPREVWAKAFGMGLLDCAAQGKRDFVGIHFSSAHQQQVFRFPKGEGSLEDRLNFCNAFFNGGTAVAQPLDLATDILEAEFNNTGKSKADIVLITDDECGVSPAWMERFQERKKRLNFRVFGIAVGMTAPGSTLVALSDNVRAVTAFSDPETIVDIYQST